MYSPICKQGSQISVTNTLLQAVEFVKSIKQFNVYSCAMFSFA